MRLLKTTKTARNLICFFLEKKNCLVIRTISYELQPLTGLVGAVSKTHQFF